MSYATHLCDTCGLRVEEFCTRPDDCPYLSAAVKARAIRGPVASPTPKEPPMTREAHTDEALIEVLSALAADWRARGVVRASKAARIAYGHAADELQAALASRLATITPEREAVADLLDGLRRRARECSKLSEGRENGSCGKASVIGKAKGYAHAADLLEALLKERHAN